MHDDLPVDLFELLSTGTSGQIGFGADRNAVRSWCNPEDVKTDGTFDRDPLSYWCIDGDGFEFFFSRDHRLRHIKLTPYQPMISMGASSVRTGRLELTLGRFQTTFGSLHPGSVGSLPKALKALESIELRSQVKANGLSGGILIEIRVASRELTLGYELATIQIENDDGPCFLIDYFLGSVWILDDDYSV